MFISAAGSLRYGEIVAVIDAAKGAGVEKVGIVTEGMRRAAGVAAGELGRLRTQNVRTQDVESEAALQHTERPFLLSWWIAGLLSAKRLGTYSRFSLRPRRLAGACVLVDPSRARRRRYGRVTARIAQNPLQQRLGPCGDSERLERLQGVLRWPPAQKAAFAEWPMMTTPNPRSAASGRSTRSTSRSRGLYGI